MTEYQRENPLIFPQPSPFGERLRQRLRITEKAYPTRSLPQLRDRRSRQPSPQKGVLGNKGGFVGKSVYFSLKLTRMER